MRHNVFDFNLSIFLKFFNHLLVPIFIIILGLLVSPTNTSAQQSSPEIYISGAMRNVMQKGQLNGTVYLDTLSTKQHLYGLGPLEYLKGELLVKDGISYVSRVGNDGNIIMDTTYKVKAPFFVYANVHQWQTFVIPSNVQNLQQLESFISHVAADTSVPFVFKLTGVFDTVKFHIQNLADGTIVKSPADAHRGQGKYINEATAGTIIGFYSNKHHSIFTHHDTNIHMHYLNDEETAMGHVDDLTINKSNVVLLHIAIK